MPEPATLDGLIVIGRTATILFLGQAAVLLLPRMVAVTLLSADLDGPVSAALQRLRPTIPHQAGAQVRWGVVDLRANSPRA